MMSKEWFLWCVLLSFSSWYLMRTRQPCTCRQEAARVEVEEEVCSICQEALRVKLDNRSELVPCGHHYHQECISRWFGSSIQSERLGKSCPFCRAGVRFERRTGNGSSSATYVSVSRIRSELRDTSASSEEGIAGSAHAEEDDLSVEDDEDDESVDGESEDEDEEYELERPIVPPYVRRLIEGSREREQPRMEGQANASSWDNGLLPASSFRNTWIEAERHPAFSTLA